MRRAVSWIIAGLVAAITATLLVVTVSAETGHQTTAAAAGQALAPVDVVYGCQISGSETVHRITARLIITMPTAALVNINIAPSRQSAKMVMPRAILEDVAPGQTPTKLAGNISDPRFTSTFVPEGGGDPVEGSYRWRAMPITAADVPETGNLRLSAASGLAPPQNFRSSVPGTVTFHASKLTMTLSAQPGGTKPATCTAEGPTLVAKVVVKAANVPAECPPLPSPPELNPDFPVPSMPPTAQPFPGNLVDGCAALKGFSNIKKLKAGVSVETLSSLAKVGAYRWFLDGDRPRADEWHRLDYSVNNDPVTATGTFLGFGFVPITTTVELTQVGRTNVHLVDLANPPGEELVIAVNSQVTLKVLKASMNGQPIDVGARCTTAKPVTLQLRGGEKYQPPYGDSVQYGGVLRGTVDIPAFTGCGVGERIDRLLTASVSGKGNEIQVTQGTLCVIPTSASCPPEIELGEPGTAAAKPGAKAPATSSSGAVAPGSATPAGD
ncbi:hypothetical protein HII36_48110 [Nonomuraea sp. NN258]|uniref:hypothetical protein n=1 Tax=Nonomuraea antri TaxID=2730852 RepID=UPI001568928F|nr:hypothetical protein [Nonomuraea antri]NRQ39544.1 hypothetical protein [Nonomuraea antri]